MLIFISITLVVLFCLICKKRRAPQRVVIESPCDLCKCPTNTSLLLHSNEHSNAKICQECAWAEHGRQYHVKWATEGHT